jgi:hypothetical protein
MSDGDLAGSDAQEKIAALVAIMEPFVRSFQFSPLSTSRFSFLS